VNVEWFAARLELLETGGAPVGTFLIRAMRREWAVEGLLKATHAWARLRTENAEHFVRSIFNCLDDFSRGCQTDDATLAVLRVL
jgi:hypothetical protein